MPLHARALLEARVDVRKAPDGIGRLLATVRRAVADGTASVERCQESWWPTSATEAPWRVRRCAFMRLS